ncbi:MAG: dihydrofolate reductase family protein [Anaerolineales bacterium]|nr:dihydrofolate reductase family protein [Anaerolineales bacterium]
MGKVIAGMTMSLDGFVEDRYGSVSALSPNWAGRREAEPLQQVIRDTGAVVMGWRTFAMAPDPDAYAGNYEFQVPIFVVSRRSPERHPKETPQLTFKFVPQGVEHAIRQAQLAAGDRDVVIVGGPTTINHALRAGLVDELQVDLVPILLGQGLRMFDEGGLRETALECVSATSMPGGLLCLKYRLPATSVRR